MRRILVLFLLLSIRSDAQISFNKRYNPFNSKLDNAFSLHIDSNYIRILIATYTSGNPYTIAASLLKLDHYGNIIDADIYSFPFANVYPGGPQSLNKANSGFIFGGSYQDSSGNADALLVRLNDIGDTLWMRKFGDSFFQSGWMAKEDDDGGFLLCGQTKVSLTPNNNSDALFIKTDSLGNLLWLRNYGDTVNLELAFALTKTADGGYVLAGQTDILTVPGFEPPSLWMTKLDSLGNMEWERIDTTISRHSLSRSWSVLSAQDGSIVVAGYFAPIREHSSTWPVVKKLDLAGNVLWDKTYFRNDSISNKELHSLRELSDGSFIAAGFHQIPPHPPRRAFLLRLDANGDSLWARDYFLEPSSIHYLSDVYPAPDGGFVACGWITPMAPDTGYQDLWILKVDSMGCEVSNCTVSIDELQEIINPMKVYPVPFSSLLNVSLLPGFEKGLIRIYDTRGRKVHEEELQDIQTQIQTSNWQDGIFLLQYTNGKNVLSRKVIRMGN
jgi:hypothetical protein